MQAAQQHPWSPSMPPHTRPRATLFPAQKSHARNVPTKQQQLVRGRGLHCCSTNIPLHGTCTHSFFRLNLRQEQARVVAERKTTVAAVATQEQAVAEKQAEKASAEGEGEVKA